MINDFQPITDRKRDRDHELVEIREQMEEWGCLLLSDEDDAQVDECYEEIKTFVFNEDLDVEPLLNFEAHILLHARYRVSKDHWMKMFEHPRDLAAEKMLKRIQEKYGL